MPTKTMSLPQPKAPSSLVKVSRWSLLLLGIAYGFSRREILMKSEAQRRSKENAERPAKEAALKAEKDRKNEEEMAYLGKEVGIIKDGGGAGGKKPSQLSNFKSDCGCSY